MKSWLLCSCWYLLSVNSSLNMNTHKQLFLGACKKISACWWSWVGGSVPYLGYVWGTKKNQGTHSMLFLRSPGRLSSSFQLSASFSSCFCCKLTNLWKIELLHLGRTRSLMKRFIAKLPWTCDRVLCLFQSYIYVWLLWKNMELAMDILIYVEIISIQMQYIILGNRTNNF